MSFYQMSWRHPTQPAQNLMITMKISKKKILIESAPERHQHLGKNVILKCYKTFFFVADAALK